MTKETKDDCLEDKEQDDHRNKNTSITLKVPTKTGNVDHEHTSVAEQEAFLDNPDGRQELAIRTSLLTRLIDPNLFKNPMVYIYCLSQSISLLAMYIPLDFLPDMMIHERNISRINAGNIIPIFGVGSIIGRILSGLVINYVKNSSVVVCSTNFILLGGCCIGYVFCHNYMLFAGLSFANGVFFGATFVLIPLTLLELFGVGSVTDTYGLVMLSSGITITFGLPLLGNLIHEFDSYSTAFFVASGLYSLAGLLSFVLLYLRQRK